MESTEDAWRGHSLRATYTQDEHGDRHLAGAHCGGCDAHPGPDDSPQGWFAGHLEQVGAADYAIQFEQFWRNLITDNRGNLNEDKIARELSDYSDIMDEVSKVYSELAGLSKPNTAAHHILAGADTKYAANYASDLADLIPEEGGLTRDELIEIVEDWSAGAWAEHQRSQAYLSELRAKNAAPLAPAS